MILDNRTDRGNINHLLKELHSKKKWLDTMIAGLEAAVDSPHIKLVEAADRALSSSPNGGPKVDLGPGEAQELAELAALAGGSRRSRGPRRAVDAA
jgi:hypothetical protein